MTNPTSESKAFICHVTKDKDNIANPLAIKLNELGHGIWYDKFSMSPNDFIEDKIHEGLEEVKGGILIISDNFIIENQNPDKKNWAFKEAIILYHKRKTRAGFLIPVFYKLTIKLPEQFEFLRNILGIEVKAGDNLNDVVMTIDNIVRDLKNKEDKLKKEKRKKIEQNTHKKFEEKTAAKEKTHSEEYNAAVAKADKTFATKDYDGAKKEYNEALSVKPSEQYPKAKIADINKILVDFAVEKKMVIRLFFSLLVLFLLYSPISKLFFKEQIKAEETLLDTIKTYGHDRPIFNDSENDSIDRINEELLV